MKPTMKNLALVSFPFYKPIMVNPRVGLTKYDRKCILSHNRHRPEELIEKKTAKIRTSKMRKSPLAIECED